MWVSLLVVMGLLGPVMVAVDVAPVWDPPTVSRERTEPAPETGEGMSEQGEESFEAAVPPEGSASEPVAGGLVPAALGHAHTQPDGSCTYGRWSSGRCRA